MFANFPKPVTRCVTQRNGAGPGSPVLALYWAIPAAGLLVCRTMSSTTGISIPYSLANVTTWTRTRAAWIAYRRNDDCD
jgi:hypothetical protein